MTKTRGMLVLDARVAEERETWLEAWRAWPEREVMAHPDYARLFAAPAEAPLCLLYRQAGATVLFPIILRPLSVEAWADPRSKASDAVTPYGYGGPFRWGAGALDEEAFWSEVTTFARERSVICLFARLSLFERQLVAIHGDVEAVAPNVVVSLGDPNQLWQAYAHKVRKNVNRAKSSGVRITTDLSGATLGGFLDIYYRTMERRTADQRYFFEAAFFERIREQLSGHFALFNACVGDKVVSTELVLTSATHIYSFLGGTEAEQFDLRPNDLLKHEIIRWGCATGKEAFVLGGGYAPDDGIFRYKKGFAPAGVTSFRVAKLIFDRHAYELQERERQSWESSSGRTWRPQANFFPSYRGSSAS